MSTSDPRQPESQDMLIHTEPASPAEELGPILLSDPGSPSPYPCVLRRHDALTADQFRLLQLVEPNPDDARNQPLTPRPTGSSLSFTQASQTLSSAKL